MLQIKKPIKKPLSSLSSKGNAVQVPSIEKVREELIKQQDNEEKPYEVCTC